MLRVGVQLVPGFGKQVSNADSEMVGSHIAVPQMAGWNSIIDSDSADSAKREKLFENPKKKLFIERLFKQLPH